MNFYWGLTIQALGVIAIITGLFVSWKAGESTWYAIGKEMIFGKNAVSSVTPIESKSRSEQTQSPLVFTQQNPLSISGSNSIQRPRAAITDIGGVGNRYVNNVSVGMPLLYQENTKGNYAEGNVTIEVVHIDQLDEYIRENIESSRRREYLQAADILKNSKDPEKIIGAFSVLKKMMGELGREIVLTDLSTFALEILKKAFGI